MLTPKSFAELADLLNDRYRRYACPAFIIGDPIQVPHGFSDKHDIEISALFAATFAWGSRKSIVNSASKLMGIMGNKPYEFVVNFSKADEHALQGFVHRTFSSADAIEFVYVLRHIYAHLGGLEQVLPRVTASSNRYTVPYRPTAMYLWNARFLHALSAMSPMLLRVLPPSV